METKAISSAPSEGGARFLLGIGLINRFKGYGLVLEFLPLFALVSFELRERPTRRRCLAVIAP